MIDSKKNLVPMLFAFAGLTSLIPAVVGPIAKGEAPNYTFVTVAMMFFGMAVVFFAVGRKPDERSGPPSA